MNDFIMRQDAIDTHCAICTDRGKCHDKEFACPDRELFRMIKPVPQKVGKWIPCSERLPKSGSVLCCDYRGDLMIGYLYEDEESNTGFSAAYDDCYMIDTVAWMPLPEPYKGENDGTD